MIAVGYVFWLLENDESMGFFRSFFCGMMFEFSGKRSEQQAAQNGAKNHIGRPNRRGSSRTGFRDSCRPGTRGDTFPGGRKAEDGRVDERYNLVELSSSSYPARTRKNIEESDGTVIFSLERRLSGGTKLTRELADKLGKPVVHIYDSRKERRSNRDSLRLEIQALTDFLCSNKIEILNVAGPRESKEPGVYEWTLTMLRFSLNRAASGAGSKETVSEWTGRQGQECGGGKSGGLPSNFKASRAVSGYFRLEPVG
jgi:hypothetical protein